MKILFLTLALIINIIGSATADNKKFDIGYKTVDEAFQAIKDSNTIEMNVNQDGWLFGTDKSVKDQYTIWTFTPESHPAYPTVIKRIFVTQNDETTVHMDIICQTIDKDSCNTLIQTFKKLNTSLGQKTAQ